MSSSQATGAQSQQSGSTVSDRVLTAVAEKEGRSALEFDRLLSDVIDPDALDAFFRNATHGKGQIEFSYMDYRVHVSADGHVDVTEQTE